MDSHRDKMKLVGSSLAVICVLIAVIAWVWARNSGAEPVRISESNPADDPVFHDDFGSPSGLTTAGSLENRTLATTDDSASMSAEPTSYRAYLERYWGSAWPDMQQRIQTWCALTGQEGCLEQVLTVELPPWEDVADRIHESFRGEKGRLQSAQQGAIGWPESGVAATEIKKQFAVADSVALGESELWAIQEIAENHNSRLRFEAAGWTCELAATLESVWASGKFERGPLILPPYQGPGALHTVSVTDSQWCVTAVLTREDFPWLAARLDELTLLRQARDDEIRSYLHSLP